MSDLNLSGNEYTETIPSVRTVVRTAIAVPFATPFDQLLLSRVKPSENAIKPYLYPPERRRLSSWSGMFAYGADLALSPARLLIGPASPSKAP